jgi:hypothetical protein
MVFTNQSRGSRATQNISSFKAFLSSKNNLLTAIIFGFVNEKKKNLDFTSIACQLWFAKLEIIKLNQYYQSLEAFLFR